MYRYILSFDVGTINLAYCLTRTGLDKTFDILEWDIIDFSYHPLLCKFTKNIRAICNDKAKYYNNDNNEIIGYCKLHGSKIKEIDNIAFKKLKLLSKNEEMTDNFNKKTDRLLIKLNELYNKICNIYFFSDDSIDICNNIEVYIENQPALKIPEMKSISIIIYTFFKMKREQKNIIKTVDFISASNKTKSNFMNPFLKELNITKIVIDNNNNINYVIRNNKNKYITSYNVKINKNKNVEDNKKNIFFNKLINDKNNFKIEDYDDRKDIIVLIVKTILDKLKKTKFNIISIANFELHKKKDDDLADAFIYCIFVLLKKNIISDYF